MFLWLEFGLQYLAPDHGSAQIFGVHGGMTVFLSAGFVRRKIRFRRCGNRRVLKTVVGEEATGGGGFGLFLAFIPYMRRRRAAVAFRRFLAHVFYQAYNGENHYEADGYKG